MASSGLDFLSKSSVMSMINSGVIDSFGGLRVLDFSIVNECLQFGYLDNSSRLELLYTSEIESMVSGFREALSRDREFHLLFLSVVEILSIIFNLVLLSTFFPFLTCLLYTSPSPRDQRGSRMPSSA